MSSRARIICLVGAVLIAGCAITPDDAPSTPSGSAPSPSPKASSQAPATEEETAEPGTSQKDFYPSDATPRLGGPGAECRVDPPASWSRLWDSHRLGDNIEPYAIDDRTDHVLGLTTENPSRVVWIDAATRQVERELMTIARDDNIISVDFSDQWVAFIVTTDGFDMNPSWEILLWDRVGKPFKIGESEMGEYGEAYPTAWPDVQIFGETAYWVQTDFCHPADGARLLRWTKKDGIRVVVKDVMQSIHRYENRVIVTLAGAELADPQATVVVDAATGKIVDAGRFDYYTPVIESVEHEGISFVVVPQSGQRYSLWEARPGSDPQPIYRDRGEGVALGSMSVSENWIELVGDASHMVIDRTAGSFTRLEIRDIEFSEKWGYHNSDDGRYWSLFPLAELESLPAC